MYGTAADAGARAATARDREQRAGEDDGPRQETGGEREVAHAEGGEERRHHQRLERADPRLSPIEGIEVAREGVHRHQRDDGVVAEALSLGSRGDPKPHRDAERQQGDDGCEAFHADFDRGRKARRTTARVY